MIHAVKLAFSVQSRAEKLAEGQNASVRLADVPSPEKARNSVN